MNCPRCGTVLEDGMQICPSCGADITSIQMSESAVTAEPVTAEPVEAEPIEPIKTEETPVHIEPIYHYDNDENDPNRAPYIEPVMSQSKFYQKTWFIILALILFWPLGLVLMWVYSDWNKVVKIIITALCALAVINMFR